MKSFSQKVANAWCSYDIANSVYKLLICTVLFPIYYHEVTADSIIIAGTSLSRTVVYDYALSVAYLAIAFVSPLLSGIADYGSRRRLFMRIFTYLGAASCMGMFWFKGDNIGYGLMVIMLAAIGYEGAVLFYNSFLPRIAPKEMHDVLSGKGYAWGYAGSMLLLIINLVLVMKFETFGFKTQLQALQSSFLQVGIWWFGFSWIALSFLRDSDQKHVFKENILAKGFKELMSVQKEIFSNATTKRFLLAFFFWSMGLQTLMLVAIMFGKAEIGIEGTKLIVTIIVLQLLAIVGATFFSRISKTKGNKLSIMVMLFIWLSVCIGGYFVQNTLQFYFLAGGVGLVMGGIQSQSRSTFSKLIPHGSNDTASYFSFYNFSEKMAIVVGMFTFGFIEQVTGSMRNSTLALGMFFIIAIIIFGNIKLSSNQ